MITKTTGVPHSWRRSRTPHTVLLDQLMEQQQRKEMGERIAQLRERSPWTQEQVGEKLGYKTPRGYQKLEENGTTKAELIEKLAALHSEWTKRNPDWQHVDANWIWDGRMPAGNDLMESLNDAQSQADLKQQVAEYFEALRAELGEKLDKLNDEVRELRQSGESSGRTRKSSGK
jgi:transcriptional regulator with XRE-family HTH domain